MSIFVQAISAARRNPITSMLGIVVGVGWVCFIRALLSSPYALGFYAVVYEMRLAVFFSLLLAIVNRERIFAVVIVAAFYVCLIAMRHLGHELLANVLIRFW